MWKRLIPVFLLIAYSAILIRVMVFKVVPVIKSGQVTLNFGGVNGDNPANFVPFSTILPYLLGEKGLAIAFLNLAGNIALLVPLGFLVPFVYRDMTWKKSLILAVFVPLIIEGMQVVLNVGIFDIDDVILNGVGVMIGYFAFIIITKWISEKNYLGMLIMALMVIISIAISFYIIYPRGHSANPQVGPRMQGNEQVDEIPQSDDLCGGTGGIGQVVSVGDDRFTIERKDGGDQIINLNDGAIIETSAGAVDLADLKMGDRVTLVGDPNPDGSFNADTVVVCGG